MFVSTTTVGSYAKFGKQPKEKGNMVFSFGLNQRENKTPKKKGGSKEKAVPFPSVVSINFPPGGGGGGPDADDAPTVLSAGLQILLGGVESVDINPGQQRTHAPEIRSGGFTIDGPDGRVLFKVPPLESESSSSSATRPLAFQSMDGVHVFHVKVETPTCSTWFKTARQAKVIHPSGGQFGIIVKTACDHKFTLIYHLSGNEKVQLDVEVVVSPSEFVVKQNEEVVAKVTARREEDHRRLHNVSFMKPDLSPNLKAMFIVFAIILVQD